jgi:hypothetical protein
MSRLSDVILNDRSYEKIELDTSHGGTKYTPPSSNCPICAKDLPHAHTSQEVIDLRVRQVKRAKLHWHTKNVVKGLENSALYYPGLFDGEGNEICKVQATDIQALIAAHNQTVDLALGFSKSASS